MSNCPTTTILSSYRIGSLPESHARLLESHVAKCPQCQAALQSMRETNTVEMQASAVEATAGSGSHEPDETEAQEELLRFLRAPAVPGEVG